MFFHEWNERENFHEFMGQNLRIEFTHFFKWHQKESYDNTNFSIEFGKENAANCCCIWHVTIFFLIIDEWYVTCKKQVKSKSGTWVGIWNYEWIHVLVYVLVLLGSVHFPQNSSSKFLLEKLIDLFWFSEMSQASLHTTSNKNDTLEGRRKIPFKLRKLRKWFWKSWTWTWCGWIVINFCWWWT